MVPGVPSDTAVAMHPDPSVAPVCGHCKSDDRWILHQVHHRKIFRILCTACVLKLHTTAFCPICFSLHHRHRKSPSPAPPPLPDIRGTLVCFKCNSPSHANCVALNTPKSPYLCPTCFNPSSKLFDLSRSAAPGQTRSIDLRMAKALRTAALIAANSLNDAAEQARAEAERKAREAVSARKRSKDALARVADVWLKDSERIRLRDGADEAVMASGNGLLGFSNGGLAVSKVMNGFPSSSQHLQKNK